MAAERTRGGSAPSGASATGAAAASAKPAAHALHTTPVSCTPPSELRYLPRRRSHRPAASVALPVVGGAPPTFYISRDMSDSAEGAPAADDTTIDEHFFTVEYQPKPPPTATGREGAPPPCGTCGDPIDEFCLRIRPVSTGDEQMNVHGFLKATAWHHLGCRMPPTKPRDGCDELMLFVAGLDNLLALDVETVEEWKKWPNGKPVPRMSERGRLEQERLAALPKADACYRLGGSEGAGAGGEAGSRGASRRELRGVRERSRSPDTAADPQMPMLSLAARPRWLPSPVHVPPLDGTFLSGTSPRAREAVRARASHSRERDSAVRERQQILEAETLERLRTAPARLRRDGSGGGGGGGGVGVGVGVCVGDGGGAGFFESWARAELGEFRRVEMGELQSQLVDAEPPVRPLGFLSGGSPRARMLVQQRATQRVAQHTKVVQRHRAEVQAAEARVEAAYAKKQARLQPSAWLVHRHMVPVVMEPRVPLARCRPLPFRPPGQGGSTHGQSQAAPVASADELAALARLPGLPAHLSNAFLREEERKRAQMLPPAADAHEPRWATNSWAAGGGALSPIFSEGAAASPRGERAVLPPMERLGLAHSPRWLTPQQRGIPTLDACLRRRAIDVDDTSWMEPAF